MIFDLRQQRVASQPQFDICIVGAGPAGISMAQSLIGSGLRVCLAESGGFTDEPTTQSLYAGKSVGHHVELVDGRVRVFGGSATRWGGRCALLDATDFEEREWIHSSGWPITREALRPYYDAAKRMTNFTQPWAGDADAMRSIGRQLPQLTTGVLKPFVWHMPAPYRGRSLKRFRPGYGQHFDWAKSYRRSLAIDYNTHVFLHANLVALTSDRKQHISSAQFRALNGNRLQVQAKQFALCCSAIENTRILLNLPPQVLKQLPCASNIGRYFGQHPRGPILKIKADRQQAYRLQHDFNIFSQPAYVPTSYELGLALTDRAQRVHKILNASAGFYYTASLDSAWMAGRRLRDAIRDRQLHGQVTADIGRIVRDAPTAAANAFRKYVTARPLQLKDPEIALVIDLEQEPREDSTITLALETDPLGVRMVQTDWKLSEIERRTARIFAENAKIELERLGYGKCEICSWVTTDQPFERTINRHYYGTTRMGRDASNAVVNEHGRVFGLDNLYVAGSGVFPTAGHANPTLTIVALAIKLAEHLRENNARPA